MTSYYQTRTMVKVFDPHFYSEDSITLGIHYANESFYTNTLFRLRSEYAL